MTKRLSPDDKKMARYTRENERQVRERARNEIASLLFAAQQLETESPNADNDFLADDMIRDANKLRKRAAALQRAERERREER